MSNESSKDQPKGLSNRIKNVAITGAGGRMGAHIAAALLETGKHVVTAITRPDSTSNLPDGVQVIRVDYTSDENSALVQSLRGQDALIITMSVSAPRDSISRLVRAAVQAGVPYVFPNWWGHDPLDKKMCDDTFLTGFKDSLLAEFQSVNPGTCSYLLLACGFWYEFSLSGGTDRYGFDFKKRSVTFFDDGENTITTSTWPQCGKAVASLLSLKVLPENENDPSVTLSQFCNGPVYISSFQVSQREMFDSVKRVTGTSDSDWTITYESSQERWQSARKTLQERRHTLAFTKMLYSRTFFPNGSGDLAHRGLCNDVLGLEKENLDEFTAVAVSMAADDAEE